MGFVQLLQLLFSLAPSVIQTVQQVEVMTGSKPGQGAKKLQTVLSVVDAAVKAAPQVEGGIQGAKEIQSGIGVKDAQAVATGVTHLVNATVGLANALGVWAPPTQSAD